MSLEKYSGTKAQTSKVIEYDSDPYSTSIVEDLLASTNEWRNANDIIRMTFKALTEVVKAQGETLKILERQLPTKASKAELHSGLSLKANVSDVTKSVADLSSSLEGKLTFDDCQLLLKDYVLKSDFQYIVSSKATIEEVQVLLEGKTSIENYKNDMTALYNKYEEWHREFNRKLTNFALQRDLDALAATVDLKANIADVNESLDSKANKQTVANALHKKANKADFEAMLAQKADQTELQELINVLETKSDISAFEKLYEQLDKKVNKDDFETLVESLSKKASKDDLEKINTTTIVKAQVLESSEKSISKRFETLECSIEALKDHIHSQLAKKSDVREVERITNLIMNKCDTDFANNLVSKYRNELLEEINFIKTDLKRATDEQISRREKKQEQAYEQLSEDLYKLNDQVQNLINDRRNDIEETATFVKSMTATTKKEIQIEVDKIEEDLERVKKVIEDISTRKIDKKDLSELQKKLSAVVESKVELNEVQSVINTSQEEVSKRFFEFKEEIKSLLRENENEVLSLLNSKANIADVNAALNTKADTAIIQNLMEQKPNVSELEEVHQKLASLYGAFEEKASTADFVDFVNEVRAELDNLKKDNSRKANIKDVCKLVDAKPNIDDVNKALTEIQKELDSKSNLSELKAALNEQALVNESLCTENIIGRWAWKSGELKSGNIVPWEIQLTNTLPDNFLWEKDKSSLLTVAPGLYEISLGFFAKKKPTVQVLLNGEPIFSAVNTASYVIHHPTGKTKEVTISKNSPGSVTGLTLVEFLVLPPRARLSFIYTGEQGGEGFVSLKRL